ncbi:MAG: cellulase family glycosylhydrolase, partial [Paludibacteraceae bacterium]|nr:cellulase family glycosylhydrolase [Paludibacteraceae bacterium]
LHFYSGDHTQSLRDKAQTALNNGAAIFVTEFGTTKASGTGGVFLDECDRWMEWMNERKISWVNWSFADKNESSAALQPGASRSKNWNMVSESGQYIKQLLSQPKNFEPCEDINGVENNLLEKHPITLYPNPTEDFFSVSVPEGEKLSKVQLFDLTGRFLFESEEDMVDVSRLDRGVYCVKVFLTNGIVVDELVKE